MNARQAASLAVGVLVVAVVIVAADGFFDRDSAPPQGTSTSLAPPADKAAPPKQAAPSNDVSPKANTASKADESQPAPKAASDMAKAPSESAGKKAASDSAAKAPSKENEVASTAPAPEKPASLAGPLSRKPDASPGAPTFDILRVEPDGSAVIAGHAAPHAKVDIMNGSKTVTSTKADGTGDFAAVLDKPLPPGDYALRLKSVDKKDKTELSKEVATVSVPKDKDGGVLAMVTKPGAPSRIITTPKPEAGAAPTEAKAGASGPSEPVASAAGDAGPASPPKGSPPATAPSAGQGSGDRDVAMLPPTPKPVTPGAAASGAGTAGPATPPTGAPPSPGDARVHVDAVEVEGDDVYVAGAAPPGSKVRVYADDTPIGTDQASPGGRFVANGSMKLPVGRHTVRADVIDPATGKVKMRASVPFERPDSERFAAVSPGTAKAAGAPASPAGKASPTPAPAASPEAKARAAVSKLESEVEKPSPQPARVNAARAMAENSLQALAGPLNFDGKAAAPPAEDATKDARDALAAIRSLPELAPQQSLDADQLEAMRSKVAGVVQTLKSLPGPPPQLAANGPPTVVQPALTTDDGFVIIRHGDTLWQISDRVYGQGVRYTTIYFANTDEIDDPNLILPGQLFDLPQKPLKDALKLHHELLRREKNR